jgi:RNA polymerase sigma-70 factor (ECF subfamily)
MASDPRSDQELIAAIQGRDVSALETLYDRHRVLAYSLALRLLGSPGDAEDVVQEAFLNVWRSAGTYRAERSSGRSWVLSIVHHRAVDKLRGWQSRPSQVLLEEGMDLPDSGDVWSEVAQSLTAQDVQRALGRLPAEQRETIELAYFTGLTHGEIARQMGVPLGTVKGRIRIGLHKLKSVFENSQRELALD